MPPELSAEESEFDGNLLSICPNSLAMEAVIKLQGANYGVLP